jgi:choline-sulfatase
VPKKSSSNVLILLSDQHNRDMLRCHGHQKIYTPNLDRLAMRGSDFLQAYCNSPICVPSRAALATGQYVHRTGYWDNAQPYDGRVPSWAHLVREQGGEAVAIGKLHFRETSSANGFTQEIETMHVYQGVGDLIGLLRQPPPKRGGNVTYAQNAGAGETTYTAYDRRIRDAAKNWLRNAATQAPDKPWVLFVSFVCPHFPLIAPEEFYRLYDPAKIPLLPGFKLIPEFSHPVLRAITECLDYHEYLRSEEQARIAIAAYMGLVSFLDDNIGQILTTLEETGLSGSTRVLYSSDHGDSLGTHGIWGKSNFYDGAAAVPLILAGPDIPAGKQVRTPVSLVDVFPTVLRSMSLNESLHEKSLPGRSLLELAHEPDQPRLVFSEYHAEGAISGIYMLRDERFKYIYYVGHSSQLFDLLADPHELQDLSTVPEYQNQLVQFAEALNALLHPQHTSERAFVAQNELIQHYGGEAAILARGDFGYSPTPGAAAL